MWFVYALVTSLAWGGADLFYKKGTDSKDKYSHVKIAIMVGLAMGIHATIYLFANGLSISAWDMVRYLPVSGLYILSMIIGYVGLRYLNLSIASPVQNASGVVVTILLVIFFRSSVSTLEIIGIVLITLGVIVIAILDKGKVDLKIGGADKKYTISFLAIFIPILYCFIDGLGTFADAIYLDEMKLISEDAALIAYEYTFFIVAAVLFIYLKIKKVPFNVFKEKDKGIAAILETAGQFFYVYAMSSNAVVTAPLVAVYSIFSVIFSRIFLKEKLKPLQYVIIGIVFVGIALMGIAESI
ncbi:MAG: EamA family transporter [Clostridiales bacterium]|nr:EamA family transporter [Clostridiales bacterium]